MGMVMFGATAAGAVEVKTIRTGVNAERTRVVFDLTGAVNYEVFTLTHPHRVVIDFHPADIHPDIAFELGAGDVLQRLRYAPRGKHGLRMVLDVSHALAAKDMRLPPAGAYGHRVVLDLSEPARGQPAAAPASLPTAGSVSLRTNTRRELVGEIEKPRPSTPAMVPLLESVGEGPALDAPVADQDPYAVRLLRDGLAGGDSMLEKLKSSVDLDISGEVGLQGRVFFQDPIFPGQSGVNGSVSFQPEFYAEWDDDNQSLLFVPFVRFYQNDPARTHFDVRELGYIYAARAWELRAGVRKVFWGVAESNHLVDVINQTDFVENIDLEDKLGQPMVNVALIQNWGTVDLFVLPGFRERTFPGRDGRFQGPFRIDTDEAEFESSAEDSHIDYALRYSHYIGPIDIGLYHFWGTSREPRFGFKLAPDGEPILFPIYDIIHQTGTDLQATLGSWLLKFEALRRQGQGDTYLAAVGGFEYTYVGVFETAMDVGVLGEYHWDERGRGASSPFNDDLFFGSRLAFNDAADSQVLGGMVSDLNGTGHFLNIEASRRIGDDWKVELEMRLLLEIAPENPLFAFNRDDHIQLELLRSF